MPEGHSIHRVALQLGADLVGRRLAASSPQGRFAAGAALLDGLTMVETFAVGKHLLVGFAEDGGPWDGVAPGSRLSDGGSLANARADARWLRVHLGLYGAWDFHGRVSPIGREAFGVGSIGAPRLRRAVRIGEQEGELPDRAGAASPAGAVVGGSPGRADGASGEAAEPGSAVVGGSSGRDDGASAEAAVPGNAVVGEFPPEPVGQVRLRLLSTETVADLRGPSRCEVIDFGAVRALLDAAGPDPRVDYWPDPEGEFVARVRRRRVAVGQLLMDQSVVSGIGNIYRAEMLFRARLSPFTPGAAVPPETVRALWRDWVELLDLGIDTGVILVREDHDAAQQEGAITDRSIRFAVYARAGEPCFRCGTPIALTDMAGRKLYWCPACQPA